MNYKWVEFGIIDLESPHDSMKRPYSTFY